MELLLVLLSEISPEKAGITRQPQDEENEPLPSSSKHSSGDIGSDSRHSELTDQSGGGDTDQGDESLSLQKYSKPPIPSSTRRGGFFGANRLSTAIGSQSKWMDEDPIAHLFVPLVEQSDALRRGMIKSEDVKKIPKIGFSYTTLSLLALSCVKTKVPFDLCSSSQSRFISSLLDLRKTLPAISRTMDEMLKYSVNRSLLHSSSTLQNSCVPPPLQILSANVVKSESHLLLERVKAAGLSAKLAGMSMATFFNPYASKKSTSSLQTTTVAEGEERTVAVQFENRLSVALQIPSCQLVFDPYGAERIEAAPLSFTIPPKGKNFSVHFPFIVLPTAMIGDSSKRQDAEMFQLLGLRVTCFSRCYFISFDDASKESYLVGNLSSVQRLIPESASLYPFLKSKKTSNVDVKNSVRIESVPAQPNLLVSFTTSEAPLEDNAMVNRSLKTRVQCFPF
jgi:hypothetical protein